MASSFSKLKVHEYRSYGVYLALLVGVGALIILWRMHPSVIFFLIPVLTYQVFRFRTSYHWLLLAMLAAFGVVAYAGGMEPLSTWAWMGSAALTIGVMLEVVRRVVTRLETIQRDLDENRRQLLTVLDTVQAGILTLDAETHEIVDANHAALALIGGERDQVIGRRCQGFICPVEPEACPGACQEHLLHNVEMDLLRVDGTRLPVLKTVSSMTVNGRRLLVESLFSISERKEMERRLRESEQQLRIVTEQTLDLIAQVDQQGRIIYASPSHTAVLGFPLEALVGHSVWQLIHPDDRKPLLEVVKDAVARGQVGSTELRLGRQDGGYVWVEATGQPLYDAQGQLAGSVVSSRDISERKNTELALRQSETKYRTLFENISDPILIFDPHSFQILDCNQAALQRYGYSRAEFLRLTTANLVPRIANGDPEDAVGADGYRQSSNLYTHVTRAGERIDVEIRTDEVEYNGQPAWLSVIRDVSDRARWEKVQAAIYQIAQAAITVEEIDDLYRSVHQILGTLVATENYYIALYDEKRHCLTFPYFVDQYDEPPGDLPVGRTMTDYVLRTGQPLLASPEVFEHLAETGEVISQGAPSVDWMGVPLVVGGKIIGVMVAQTYTEGVRFGQPELEIMMFVSSQIAMTIYRKQAEARLRAAEARYRQMVEQVMGVIYVEPLGEEYEYLRYTSPQVEVLTGYPYQEWRSTQEPWLAVLHPEDHARVIAEDARCRANSLPFCMEYRIVTRSGRVVWVLDQAVQLSDENGRPQCRQGLVYDITERKTAEERLRQSEAALAEAQELAHLGSFHFEPLTGKMDWSEETYRILGRSPLERPLAFPQVMQMVHPEDRFATQQAIDLALSTHQPFDLEYRVVLPDGQTKHLHSVCRPTNNNAHYVGMILDITDRKRSEEKLWMLSTHDVLTGLYNRAYFESQLNQLHISPENPASILLMDVDRLKQVNDRCGHAAGDELLRRAAQAFRQAFRKEDIVARIGGDEFAVVLPGANKAAAEAAVTRLRNLLAVQAPVDNLTLDISIGAATGPENGSPTELMRLADQRMYADKVAKKRAAYALQDVELRNRGL